MLQEYDRFPSGELSRMYRVFDTVDDRAVVTPVDDLLLATPAAVANGDEAVVERILTGRPNAIVGFMGTLDYHRQAIARSAAARIVNVTFSFDHFGSPTQKRMLHTVHDAVRTDAAAVAVHVNAESVYAPEMLENLHTVVQEAAEYEMPVFGFMYPRGEKEDGSPENFTALRDEDPQAYAGLLCRAVELGVRAGVRAIKTHYTGDPESFAPVVQAARGVPLLMAGGSERSYIDALQMAYDSCAAGASGTSFGRNIFNSGQATEMVLALNGIVHKGYTVREAIAEAGLRPMA